MVEIFETGDERRLPIFIHSELDDYGLTCIEFRVYGRLARRAGSNRKASESVENMAETFDLSVRTVQRALRVLCEANVVKRQTRPGKVDFYVLNDKEAWKTKIELNAIQDKVYERDRKRSGDASGTSQVVTPAAEGGDATLVPVVTPGCDEGTPNKVLLLDSPTTRAREESDQKRKTAPARRIPRIDVSKAGQPKGSRPMTEDTKLDMDLVYALFEKEGIDWSKVPEREFRMVVGMWRRDRIAKGQWRADWQPDGENYLLNFAQNHDWKNWEPENNSSMFDSDGDYKPFCGGLTLPDGFDGWDPDKQDAWREKAYADNPGVPNPWAEPNWDEAPAS